MHASHIVEAKDVLKRHLTASAEEVWKSESAWLR